MQTGSMTTTQNAPWIPEVIANEALGLLGNYLNLGRTVLKDSELTPVRFGQVISIPRRGTVVAQQKSQGSSTSVQRPAADDVQITVDQHWYVKLAEEDFTAAMQTGSVLPGYVEDSTIVLAEKIESQLTTHFSEFANRDAGGSAGDALEGVILMRELLTMQKVPVLATRFAYIHPTFVTRLLREEAFIDPKTIPTTNALIEGAVGRVSNFDTFEGQLVPTAGSPAWYQNFFYTRNALVLASRPLIQPGQELGVQATSVQSDAGLALRLVRYYDPDEMAVVVQLDTLFGTGVNDVRQGAVLESQAVA